MESRMEVGVVHNYGRHFDTMIGVLDRILSDMLLYAGEDKPGALDDADWQTLKHHAEDMEGAAGKILRLYRNAHGLDDDGEEEAERDVANYEAAGILGGEDDLPNSGTPNPRIVKFGELAALIRHVVKTNLIFGSDDPAAHLVIRALCEHLDKVQAVVSIDDAEEGLDATAILRKYPNQMEAAKDGKGRMFAAAKAGQWSPEVQAAATDYASGEPTGKAWDTVRFQGTTLVDGETLTLAFKDGVCTATKTDKAGNVTNCGVEPDATPYPVYVPVMMDGKEVGKATNIKREGDAVTADLHIAPETIAQFPIVRMSTGLRPAPGTDSQTNQGFGDVAHYLSTLVNGCKLRSGWNSKLGDVVDYLDKEGSPVLSLIQALLGANDRLTLSLRVRDFVDGLLEGRYKCPDGSGQIIHAGDRLPGGGVALTAPKGGEDRTARVASGPTRTATDPIHGATLPKMVPTVRPTGPDA